MAAAEGNPFFVEDLTLSLLEKGILRKAGRAVVMTKHFSPFSFPSTVQGILLSRVDRLPARSKAVIQAAAVIGRVFSVDLLERTLGLNEGLEEILWQLEDQELSIGWILNPKSVTPSNTFWRNKPSTRRYLRPNGQRCTIE